VVISTSISISTVVVRLVAIGLVVRVVIIGLVIVRIAQSARFEVNARFIVISWLLSIDGRVSIRLIGVIEVAGRLVISRRVTQLIVRSKSLRSTCRHRIACSTRDSALDQTTGVDRGLALSVRSLRVIHAGSNMIAIGSLEATCTRGNVDAPAPEFIASLTRRAPLAATRCTSITIAARRIITRPLSFAQEIPQPGDRTPSILQRVDRPMHIGNRHFHRQPQQSAFFSAQRDRGALRMRKQRRFQPHRQRDHMIG
jgi:hypothetical protein